MFLIKQSKNIFDRVRCTQNTNQLGISASSKLVPKIKKKSRLPKLRSWIQLTLSLSYISCGIIFPSEFNITYIIKQFVVTNCSKEQPGLIVTKTLKNGILLAIATSKELHFNADFKNISLIKFSLTHQKLRAWENLPYFRKWGKRPLKVIES